MIEIDDLRHYMGAGSLTAEQVIVLQDLEKRAVSFVEVHTGRHFGPVETFTTYHDGTGNRRLWLDESPDSITTVRERRLSDETWDAVLSGDDDGWELRGRQLLRKNGHVWSYGYEHEVVYDFGYAPGTEPGAIRQLVMDLVKLKWDSRDLPTGLVSQTEGMQSVTYERSVRMRESLMSIPWVGETIAEFSRVKVA